MEMMAAAIKRLQRAPPFAGTYSPFDQVRRFGEILQHCRNKTPPAFFKACDKLEQLQNQTNSTGRPLVPTHNDLSDGNVLDAGDWFRLVDWEVSAMGDPLFEIAKYAAHLELSESELHTWLTLFELSTSVESLREVRVLMAAAALRNCGLCFVQAVVTDRHDYHFARGQLRLERFNYNVKSIG